MDEYYNAIDRLPGFVKQYLDIVPSVFAPFVQEIHLRSGRAVVLTIQNKQKELASLLAKPPHSIRITHNQLKECFFGLCGNSVHSYETQLAQGFFTLPGGHRVGIAGILQTENGILKGFQSITSLNIRVARTIAQPLPEVLLNHLSSTAFRGVVLIGPPGSGKTTFLRSISRVLSDKGKKISVIDERMEIWPCGPFGFAGEVPANCDVLSGFQKRSGIQQALRSLGPEVILCDELGNTEEMELVNRGTSAGVQFICTLHGNDCHAPLLRFGMTHSQLENAFSCLVLLDNNPHPGTIKEVCLL